MRLRTPGASGTDPACEQRQIGQQQRRRQPREQRDDPGDEVGHVSSRRRRAGSRGAQHRSAGLPAALEAAAANRPTTQPPRDRQHRLEGRSIARDRERRELVKRSLDAPPRAACTSTMSRVPALTPAPKRIRHSGKRSFENGYSIATGTARARGSSCSSSAEAALDGDGPRAHVAESPLRSQRDDASARREHCSAGTQKFARAGRGIGPNTEETETPEKRIAAQRGGIDRRVHLVAGVVLGRNEEQHEGVPPRGMIGI